MDVVDDDEEEKVEMMDEKEAGPEHYDSDSDERMGDKGRRSHKLVRKLRSTHTPV